MKYVCQVCGYVYDEAVEKIPFKDLPEDWKCPLCGAPKSAFKPEGGEAAAPAPVVVSGETPDLKKLSAGQLAALCSSLARGCDKQYKEEEAGLFRELSDYFTAVTPAVEDATVENIAQMIQADIDNYGLAHSTAKANGDRGADRALVWSEKVTNMLSALVNRYLTEGEAMLADTEIWVCTACGFVYIGDTPPELCPVCKVPSWKFEKIERRVSA